MPRYIVTLTATRIVEVEAADETEANDKAADMPQESEVYWIATDCDEEEAP